MLCREDSEMKLIVITKETFFDEEAKIIDDLFAAGLVSLHLRKPFASEDELRKLLMDIPVNWHNKIVLHDHFSLINSFCLKGVHLNRRNHEPPQEKEVSISTSCHTLKEVEVAQNKCDYLFLSPIFDSISKLGYRQGFTREQLLAAKECGIINHKVIALGGVTPATVPLLNDFGFGGIAVLGWLWGNVEKDMERVLLRFEQLKQALL